MHPSSVSKTFFGSTRKARIISVSALFLAVCAFGAAGVAPLAPDAANLPVKTITQDLILPQMSEQIAELETRDQRYVSEEKIRPGDTLATLLTRLGVDDDAAAAFIKSNDIARAVLQLRPGKRIQAQTSGDGELLQLNATVADSRGNLSDNLGKSVGNNPVKNIVVERVGNSFKAYEAPAQLEKRIEMHSGEIKSSLFAATDAAQIPDNIASQIVDMFSTDIDFASDLRRGDHFDVVYETFWQNGELVGTGRIVAAEFVNAGKTLQSVWFDDPSSKQGGGYYGFDGKSLKKAFLKSPLEFTRISSGFSMRVHPISGLWKKHEGIDFAAPTGTPIRASGDGEINFIGTQNGYGNVVMIKHWSNYSTAYAHMSRFATGIHKGTKVTQGEIIGYVGSTGWATGPHLHYEFRVDNKPRDPMSVVVPNAPPLADGELQRFRVVAADMSHRFMLLNPEMSNVTLASR